jgi:DNA-binding beta-propeller fold protein YncE
MVSGGSLWVADFNNDRVQKFSLTDNSFEDSIDLSAIGGVSNIVADPSSGNFYVVDSGGKINEITPTGAPVRTIGEGVLDEPYGLVIDPATGRLYVSDFGLGKVVVFNGDDGDDIDTIGGFDGPVGLAFDPLSRILYVADSGNSRVARFEIPAPPACTPIAGVEATTLIPTSVSLDCAGSGPLTYEIVTAPAHGVITQFDPETGALTYVPEAGYAGPDSLAFTATDAAGVSQLTTVSFTVKIPPVVKAQVAPAPVPIVHETTNLSLASGTVLIKVPGEKNFKKLDGSVLVPLGTVIDATDGRVFSTLANKAKEFSTAQFWGGVFDVIQTSEDDPVDVMRLRNEYVEGAKCRPDDSDSANTASISSTKSVTIAKKKKKAKNKVWGDGKGKFRTQGSGSSASVRGTRWLLADYADGTLVSVSKGLVAVKDFAAHKTFQVKAGESHFAPLKKKKRKSVSCK